MEKKTAFIRSRLLAAYDGGKRDLPWRRESDPYRVWVSEIMLQQTRVETVIPYYERWVKRFPTLDDLARAEEDEVLKAWEGLGYYGRARRLHGAARVVRERHAGEVPGTQDELLTLPGVGEYTAGAVASISFGEAVPAVDGNVRRVLCRLFDVADPSPSELRTLAASMVDPARPGDFNQALMELGATVCLPRSPRCEQCPIGETCEALAAGTVDQRPSKKTRKPVPEVEIAVVVAVWAPRRPRGLPELDGSGPPQLPGPHFLLRKRPDTGLLAGMWEFPGTEVQAPSQLGEPCGQEVEPAEAAQAGHGDLEPEVPPLALRSAHNLAASLGLSVEGESVEFPPLTHIFSHLKAHYQPFLFRVQEKVVVEGGRWVSAKELNGLPLPVAQQKIGRMAMEFIEASLASGPAKKSEPEEPE